MTKVEGPSRWRRLLGDGAVKPPNMGIWWEVYEKHEKELDKFAPDDDEDEAEPVDDSEGDGEEGSEQIRKPKVKKDKTKKSQSKKESKLERSVVQMLTLCVCLYRKKAAGSRRQVRRTLTSHGLTHLVGSDSRPQIS